MRHRLSPGVCHRGWSIVADLVSAGNCARGLETAHIPRNKDAPEKITIYQPMLPQSRRDFGYNLLLNQNITYSTLFSGEKIIAAFDLNFYPLKSTNVNNVS